jgi:hypothetical protein
MAEDTTRTFTRPLTYDEFDPNEVISIFTEIGIQPWLAEHPFEKIEFSGKVLYENREVHGLYSFVTQELQIATTRTGYEIPFQ